MTSVRGRILESPDARLLAVRRHDAARDGGASCVPISEEVLRSGSDGRRASLRFSVDSLAV